MKNLSANLAAIFMPILVGIVLLSMARLGYVIWLHERITEAGEISFILLQGLRFDLVLMALIMILPTSLTPLFALHRLTLKAWQALVLIYSTLWLALLVFMEIATPSFINQYDVRPNYLFVEYLQYFREVGATLFLEYPLQLLAAALIVPIFAWQYVVRYRQMLARQQPLLWYLAIPLAPLLFIGLLMSARSTLDHRAVNPATVAVTPDPLVNQLALSSTYTLLYAIYQSRYDRIGGKAYGDMPIDKAYEIVRQESRIDHEAFALSNIPTWHIQQSSRQPKRPFNLVIILEESLGAEFVGKLGGLPLTPNIDRLADEGIWFDNLYATGTRSVRGIEAVVSGFTPSPAISIVKQNKAQQNFFTLAGYLKQYNYDTGFIYGGESHFDNMRGFFMGNGFQYVIDKNDYKDPVLTGSWGVSDEDLFTMADKKFRSYANDQPFFSLVFTSSNHSPYEYPDGRIEQYDSDKRTVNNAVKYADHAVGEFIRKAKQSHYWDNTIFIIIADHNSRAYGNSLIPIEHFHIPGLILGGPIQPDVIQTQASQIDIAPTLLSLMGISGSHPMIGRDLTDPRNRAGPGRSIMQFYDLQAYREAEDIVVLRHDLPPALFTYQAKTLLPSSENKPELVKKALAHSIFSQTSYAERLYPQYPPQ